MKEKIKKERTPEQIEQTRIKRTTTSLRKKVMAGCGENGIRRYSLELEYLKSHPEARTSVKLGRDIIIFTYEEAIQKYKESLTGIINKRSDKKKKTIKKGKTGV
jgi:hypothetical protein